MAWAPYRRDGDRIGLPRVSNGSWSERLDVAKDAEPPWVVLVDRALAGLIRIHAVYEPIIKIYYLDNKAIWQVADKARRTEQFVAMSLRGACSYAEERVAYEPESSA
jgi:hypothetical protein